MKTLLLIFGFLFSTQLMAADPVGECKASRWPFSRKQGKPELQALFSTTKREALIQYLFSEVTSPKDESVAAPLSTYLTQTELNKDRRAFFRLISLSAEMPYETSKPRQLDLTEICDFYEQVFRGPASTKQ